MLLNFEFLKLDFLNFSSIHVLLVRYCGIGFHNNFSKKLSSGPKNGLDRGPLGFSTICAKNQGLKLNIDKVTITYWRLFPVGSI
jgi:hypothetical protein